MSRRTAAARRVSPPTPAEPPPAATVPIVIAVRSIAFCATCGFSRLAHAGPKGDGPCLVPGTDCQAYQEAADAHS